MASTYTDLGLELMATGENAGTWGTKTNANLNLVEQITGGYLEVSIAGGVQSTPLDVSDGALTGKAQNRIIKFTGTITGNQTVTLPVLMENFYIIENATTGVYTVELKALTGSGATVTWGTADKGWKILYADGVATNTGIYDTGFSTSAGDVTLTGTQTLTNKTLTTPIITSLSNSGTVTIPSGADTLVARTSTDTLTNKTLTAPKIVTNILDSGGNKLFVLTATGSAVNEFTIANAATGGAPNIIVSGDDTNIDFNITPKGIGRATFNGQGKIQSVAEKVTTEATAATGTVNYDVLTQAVWNFTTNAGANWTLNVRGDGSNSLDSIMDTGESITVAHIVSQGATAYYNSAFQIDGGSVTPEWQGGAAPTEGNASSLDTYSYTIIKTASATFTVLASLTQFA